MNLGLRPNKLGIAQNREDSLSGRPKAFRTSAGIAGDFLGNPMIKVAFVVSGDQQSAMAYRARAFAARLREYDIEILYREANKILALSRIWNALRRMKPEVVYVFDMSYSGVLGAWLHRLLNRTALIIETGDVIYELMRSTGNRGRVGLWLTRRLENFSLRTGDRVVVRGRFHQQWLEERGLNVDVLQDGVDVAEFAAQTSDDLRAHHGLDCELTVGMVGTSIWSDRLQMCYGWELVELLRLMKDKPVKGIMIGGGSGIAHLKQRCREYEIEDKVLFFGYVPYEQLPRYLSMIDVCLSTQTNDIVGQVRTTGKLPLYLAAGRFVLASKVGEAAIVLDEKMLVQYEGVKDQNYPQKLRERIESIITDPELLNLAADNVDVAKKNFDYAVLAERLAVIINSICKHSVAIDQIESAKAC